MAMPSTTISGLERNLKSERLLSQSEEWFDGYLKTGLSEWRVYEKSSWKKFFSWRWKCARRVKEQLKKAGRYGVSYDVKLPLT